MGALRGCVHCGCICMCTCMRAYWAMHACVHRVCVQWGVCTGLCMPACAQWGKSVCFHMSAPGGVCMQCMHACACLCAGCVCWGVCVCVHGGVHTHTTAPKAPVKLRPRPGVPCAVAGGHPPVSSLPHPLLAPSTSPTATQQPQHEAEPRGAVGGRRSPRWGARPRGERREGEAVPAAIAAPCGPARVSWAVLWPQLRAELQGQEGWVRTGALGAADRACGARGLPLVLFGARVSPPGMPPPAQSAARHRRREGGTLRGL